MPDDLANLILLLVSDYASAVTGQFVLADMGAHIALNRPASVPHRQRTCVSRPAYSDASADASCVVGGHTRLSRQAWWRSW